MNIISGKIDRIQIPFHNISIDDAEWFSEAEKNDPVRACDCTFASLFAWSEAYNTQLALICGTGVARYITDMEKLYYYPTGGTAQDRACAVEVLLDLAREDGDALKFTVLTDEHRSELENFFPGRFRVFSDRDHWDYIVSRSKLADFRTGTIAKSEVYNLRRFLNTTEYSYEKISGDNIDQCIEFAREWKDIRLQSAKFVNTPEAAEELEEEFRVLRRSFVNFTRLGLEGGLLRSGGRIIAFAAGKMLGNDTFVFQYRKALSSCRGSSQAVTRELCRSLEGRCSLINLEDDLGDPGLRQAKMYNHPDSFIEKYYAIESEVCTASEEDDYTELWTEAFGDPAEYVDFYRKNRHNIETAVIKRNGRIVSMAGFWPASLKFAAEDGQITIDQPVTYVYAVATAMDHRRQGLAEKILDYGLFKYQHPLILIPANEELKQYYKKRGFEDYFSPLSVEANASDNGIEVEILQDTDPEKIKIAMERNRKLPFLSWDAEAVKYAVDETFFCGGKAARIGEDYALYYVEDEKINVSQYTGEDPEKALAALAFAEGRSCAVLKISGGMILWYGVEKNLEILRNYRNPVLTLAAE